MSSSSTTTEEHDGAYDYSRFVSPSPHPGEHLREDYLPDHDMTVEQLATALKLSDPQSLLDVVDEKADLTADLALRLGRLFNQSADMWLGLQAGHDLSKAAIAKREELARIRPLAAA